MKIGTSYNKKGMVERYADMNGIYDNYYELISVETPWTDAGITKEPAVKAPVYLEKKNEILKSIHTDPLTKNQYVKLTCFGTHKKQTGIFNFYYRFVKTVNHPIELVLPQ